MGIEIAIINVPLFKETLNMMLVLKLIVIYATFICVSAATKTLNVRGNTVHNQSFDLICFTAVNVSVPYAVFFRRNISSQEFSQVAAVLYYPSLPSCNVTDSSSKNYTYSCSNAGTNITLTVPAENEDEHNTFWRCSNPGSQNEENNNVIQIFINDPVHIVTIRNNTVVTVTEGISETFVCETFPCRPSADICWTKNGINVTNPQGSSSIRQSGTKNITRSSLLFTAVKGDNGSLLACAAYNGYGTRQLSANVTIVVHYPPIVNPLESPVSVIQGRPLEIVCSADGNPSPQLTWNPLGEDSVNRSRLYYSAISRHNAVIHTCTATNIMVPTTGNQQPMSDSKELLIDLLYSPTVNSFTSPVKVIEGHPLKVVCSADGNPSPQVTWNPAGEDRLNKSRLYYSAISRDISGIHTCTATNIMVPTTGNQQLGSHSKGFFIDVLYSPIVNPFTLPEVIEGQPMVVVCSADGNPTPLVTWDPEGEDKVNKSRLYYSAVSRDMAVPHICSATNIMVPTTGSQQTGSDFKPLLIDVLYNASISVFTSKNNISMVNEHSSFQLLCQVDSNPNSVISLYLENNLKLKVENAQNLTYTKTAVCLDSGRYTCSAQNRIMNGDAVSRSMQINVTCYPRFDHRRNISTEHYGSLGDNVTLEVYVIAYPEPRDITWYHKEKETDVWQMFPYQNSSSSGLYSSIIVHLASEREFRYYMVNMSNGFGIYNNTYHIIPESMPGVPTNFTVTVNGPDSVELEWMPGNWGGHPQHFIIQYRILPDGIWVKLDQIRDSGATKQTFTITGLQQKTTYEFHLYAENIKGRSEKSDAIVTTPATTFNSPGVEVAGIAGGISAGLVVIIVVGMGIFFWRRYKRQTESDKDAKMGNEERSQIKPNSIKQDAGSGKVYEGLRFRETDGSQYLELNDVALEENRHANLRPPKSDSYEQLHPYTNSDIQMYSSLTIPETPKDSDEKYENTWK